MLLIDGDILCYRVVFSREAVTLDEFYKVMDSYIKNIVDKADPDIKNYTVYLTGAGNFRKEVAVTAPYKGNRPPKPEGLEEIRQYLVDFYPTVITVGEEADDLMAIEATARRNTSVLCTIDKDFDQVPGKHYNFVKDIRYTVEDWEGLFFFYTQVLTGDRVDNIIGLQGIGPKKAEKALKDCKTELELYQKCLEMYDNNEQRVIENGRLLWLRREAGQMWEPPAIF